MWEALAPVRHLLLRLGQGQGQRWAAQEQFPREGKARAQEMPLAGGLTWKGPPVCPAQPRKVPKPRNSTHPTFWGTSTFRSLSR